MLCQVIVVGSTTKSRFCPNCCCCTAAASSSSSSSSGFPLLAGSEDSGVPRLEATNRTVRATAAVASTATTLGGAIFLLLEQRHRRKSSGMGACLEEAHVTSGEQHARTNTHAIHKSSLFQTRALLSPFFYWLLFRQKEKLKMFWRNLKFENSKTKR